MKLIIDSAIPFIKDRIPSSIDTLYVPGKEITPEIVRDADALVVRTRTKCDERLLKNSKVKLVATATIGTDHIDVPWCEANNIEIKNAPGCNAPGVAQYVFASLFRTGGFDSEIHTLGIIGYGNVGKTVAQWAKEMGIKTMICDPPLQETGSLEIEYTDKFSLLKECDAVTLHVPFTKEGSYPTFHLIGEQELKLMKKGAILINSSRGGVVDEKSLKESLKGQELRAVIDVWENEPDIDNRLLQLCDIATPHIAGYSLQGKMRATGMVLEALNEKFGIGADVSGLLCIPPAGISVSKELIEKSYNPLSDTSNLKNNPKHFEELRTYYIYREEPLFLN